MMSGVALFFVLAFPLVHGGLEGKKAGPFDIVIRTYAPCPDQKKGLNTVRAENVTLKSYNRTVSLLSGSLILDEDVSDTCSGVLSFSQFTSGGIKENYLNQKFGSMCESLKTLAPEVYTSLIHDVFDIEGCPVRKGVYQVKDFSLIIDSNVGNLPKMFFYGHYYVDAILKCYSRDVGCFRFVVDIVRKQNKRG